MRKPGHPVPPPGGAKLADAMLGGEGRRVAPPLCLPVLLCEEGGGAPEGSRGTLEGRGAEIGGTWSGGIGRE